MYTKESVVITHVTEIKIVTSGYSDRFVITLPTYTAKVFTYGGQSVTCSFDDRRKMIDFLVYLVGLPYEDACALLPSVAQYRIKGRTDRRTYSSRGITSEQVSSIQDYLVINHGHGFRESHLEALRKRLADNPLEPDVLAIVLWQISECDRQNVETWGNKDGRSAPESEV